MEQSLTQSRKVTLSSISCALLPNAVHWREPITQPQTPDRQGGNRGQPGGSAALKGQEQGLACPQSPTVCGVILILIYTASKLFTLHLHTQS